MNVLTDREGNEFELRPISCPTCGEGPEIVLGLRGGKHQRYGQGVETTIVQCESCGLLYANPFPFPRSPQTLYGDPDKYFELHGLDAKIAFNRGLASEIAARCGKASPRLLDIGAGRGDFLHAARSVGFEDVTGLEFSDAMIASARQLFGVELLRVSAEDFAQRQHLPKFDAVVLNAVLEHVYDPDALIRSVAKMTAPGAVLYVDVPNEPHLLTYLGNTFNRMLGRSAIFNLQPTWPPFHVFGFNPRALRRLLGKHGFVIDSIRCWAQPHLPSSGAPVDRLKSFVGRQAMRVANHTGTASNLFVWATRI